ncbi:hypothetical protein [Mycolicibacterium mucogenicum]|uniref:Uncharacterized protein n=1 Tax=Mycolicibacterium mucogenicum DSM 44124 TaxID=1226753 RepID=A0A8H2JJU7_MYCMU|nr:hypothetical protein [Mycolicibacterium mucogenicum]KAB7754818.1 hypothetical protein MMUC44124_21430 [Mycolicibacterium mucogenicum DSM 44124]QPG69424.1 hypothetical protein C1S78_029430 [Mycolicibacterium mucogenicum DSM 44124]
MKEQIVNNAKVEVTDHKMTRLDIHTAMPFADFRARFERAAPVLDDDVVRGLVERQAPWADMRAAMEKMAPLELIRYVTIDATAVMSLAGNRTQAPVHGHVPGPLVARRRCPWRGPPRRNSRVPGIETKI